MKNLSHKPLIFALLFIVSTGLATSVTASELKTKNLVLITMDGFRWKEMFTGADSLLINDKNFVDDKAILKKAFWRDTPAERRKVLLPFFWSTIEGMAGFMAIGN